MANVNGQGNNLFSWGSFDFPHPTFPNDDGQINRIDNEASWLPFRNTTTDWIENTPGQIRGFDSCQTQVTRIGTDTAGAFLPVPVSFVPNHDDAYFAGLLKWVDREGEGLQQQLDTKMREGFYSLSFWYYLPCKNYEYDFSVWASTKKDKGGVKEKLATIQLSKDTLHQWRKFETAVEVSNPSKRFDWFLILFEGTSTDPEQPYDDPNDIRTAYVFLDDFNLERLPCTGCIPHGDVAINALYIEHFSPGVTPGYNDEFVFGPIYNATKIWVVVEDVRNEVVVYEANFRNTRGFYGSFVTWNGLTNTGGTNGVPAVTGYYAAKITAENCDHEREIVFPINICDSAICQPEPVSHPLAQSYEIPEWNRPPFPYGMDNLVVTGRYDRSEFFRSCGSITVGDSSNLALGGFSTGTNAQLNFRAHDFILLSGQVNADSGIADFRIDTTLECCPPAPNRPVQAGRTVQEREWGLKPVEGEIPPAAIIGETEVSVFPVPFGNQLTFSLPVVGWLEVVLRDAQGQILLEAGMQQGKELVLDTGALPVGMYFCQVNRSGGGRVVKVVKYGE